MVHYPSVQAAGVERCRGAGYTVETATDPGDPPALSTTRARLQSSH
jgi:hypothetical protein